MLLKKLEGYKQQYVVLHPTASENVRRLVRELGCIGASILILELAALTVT